MAGNRNNKAIAWLYSQFSSLIENGVITKTTAEKIREHYGDVPQQKKISGMVIFSAFGSTLVGLGILLIIAFNWSSMPRLLKILLSFMPLAAGIIMARFAAKKKTGSASWNEGAAGFWFLSIGATISMITQTYNIHGQLSGFLFMWVLLGLPIMYLLNSSFAYFLYMGFLVGWASMAQLDGGFAVGFWPLSAAAMPFFIKKFRENKYSGGVIRNSLITAITFSIGTGVALEKCVPGLWIVIYMALFSVLYQSSGMIYRERESVLRRPFQWYSVIAIAVLSLMLTYSWPWREIGWHYYRTFSSFNSYAALMDYGLAIILPSAAILLLRDSIKAKKHWLIDYGLAPLVAAACFLISVYTRDTNHDILGIPVVLFIMNLYAGFLGIRTIMAGVKLGEMSVINGGMLMLGTLILMRYFDMDMGLLERGIAFIITGAAILGTNAFISKGIGKKHG
jgi:uncharacterized membrane protein